MAAGFQIAPSIVSAPLLGLKTELDDLKSSGIDLLHIDIEDGHFVPVMNLGTRIIEALKDQGFFLDVHLMVDNPELMIPQVARLGADSVTIHYEASPYPRRYLHRIRQLGLQTGLAFNPKTPLADLDFVTDLLDCVNILTTEPEDPDCPFIPAMIEKIKTARAWADRVYPTIQVVADGAISRDNIASVVEAGATRLVVGRSIFGNHSIGENIAALWEVAQ